MLDIPGKPVFGFRLMPYSLKLFHWGVCRASKLGAMSKMKSCQIWSDCMESAWYVMFCFTFVSECTHTHCPFIIYRNPPKQNIMLNFNSGTILEHLFFDIAPNIITLCTFLPGNHNNNVPMERNKNSLSNDTLYDDYDFINKLVSSIKVVVQLCNINFLTLNAI